MARGKQRIRQRGSRQQWAQARNFKTIDGITTPGDVTSEGPTVDAPPATSVSANEQRIARVDKCGLCGIVVEQKRMNGSRELLVAYALCISCDEIRCLNCWDVDDDLCTDSVDEHEFAEINYAVDGECRSMEFNAWFE